MKRSQINAAIDKAMAACRKNNFTLPCFGYFTPADWKTKGEECKTIVDVMLGWDVTDFGSGDFDRVGAVLFTLRNGSCKDPSIGVPYAEKLMMFDDTVAEQEIPLHFHFRKHEDIINRAGGTMCVQLFGSTPDGDLDREHEIVVYTDGIRNVVPAGTVMEITTGNSITLTPGLYHRIFVKKGTGMLIAGEVSSINDDHIDNRFYETTARFCAVEEDEPKRYILANEYEGI
ncbi:MAG: D-lyxose/D-mannose family sugar isomerase [Clostridia bacterium]|nr:D-lyxose/D-mannose family sugar isomerase [Clostridia bacterium]